MASPSKSQIDAMLAEAKCFECLGPATLMEIETYLLAAIYGDDGTDPSTLQHSAKCLQCLSYSTLLRIKAYLLSKINETTKNGSMDLNVLLKEYACYSCIPKGMLLPLETWLLTTDAQAPATKDPSGLAKLAKCFHCLSPETLLEIQVYLLARITGFPIDPNQLAHESTSFQPIEGIGPSWVSVGAVSETLDFGGGGSISCTDVAYQLVPVITAHYDGSGNITTIDVLLPKVCCEPFGWTIYGSNNADMSGAVYVNGALIPPAFGGGNNYSVTGIDVSLAGFKYYAARQRCADLAETDYSNIVLEYDGTVVADEWATRVVANGGAMPSDATINAAAALTVSLKLAGIWSKIKGMNICAPDSLIAARTPYIVGGGNDPYTRAGPGPGNETVGINGISQTAQSYGWRTNLNPTTLFSDNLSAGMTIYVHTQGTTNNRAPCGCRELVSGESININYAFDAGKYQACLWKYANSGNIEPLVWLGYISMNRVAANDLKLFGASSVLPHVLKGSYVTADGIARPSLEIAVGTSNWDGAYNNTWNGTYSFWAVHLGLTEAESSLFFDAIQAFRVALGGGFV